MLDPTLYGTPPLDCLLVLLPPWGSASDACRMCGLTDCWFRDALCDAEPVYGS